MRQIKAKEINKTDYGLKEMNKMDYGLTEMNEMDYGLKQIRWDRNSEVENVKRMEMRFSNVK